MVKPKYSLETRLAVVNHYLSGKEGIKHIADFFGIESTSVRRWVRAWLLHSIDGITWKNDHHSPEFRKTVSGRRFVKNLRCAKLQHVLLSQMKVLSGTGLMSTKPQATKDF